MAPAYLAADCQLVYDEDRRQLHSATSSTYVKRTHNFSFLLTYLYSSRLQTSVCYFVIADGRIS